MLMLSVFSSKFQASNGGLHLHKRMSSTNSVIDCNVCDKLQLRAESPSLACLTGVDHCLLSKEAGLSLLVA